MRQTGIANLTKEERLRMQLHVEMQHDGGNPSQLLELLAEATETNAWERLVNGSGKSLAFIEFIERPYPDGIGLNQEDLKTIIKLKHQYERKDRYDGEIAERMDMMRQRVLDLLTPAIQSHGGQELQLDTVIKGNNITFDNDVKSIRGTSADYTIRRLKRDRPDLAEKVIIGDVSANAAAIEAGFRKRTISIPVEAESAARSIKKHFDQEQIERLITLLS